MLSYPDISPYSTLSTSRYYSQLRELGITEIYTLSGAFWTDHNLHDPGITLMEALIYALTDLGYRVDHELAVLLASHPAGGIVLEEHFHRAKEILPNCAYTPEDYKKYFLNIPGIQNLIVEREIEFCPKLYCRIEEKAEGQDPCVPPFYSVSFDKDTHDPAWQISDREHLQLNGLYCISLVLEPEVYNDIDNPLPVLNLAGGTAMTQIHLQGQSPFQATVHFPGWSRLNLDIWGDPKRSIREIRMEKEFKLDLEAEEPVFETEVAIHFGEAFEPERLPLKILLDQEGGYSRTVKIPGLITSQRSSPLPPPRHRLGEGPHIFEALQEVIVSKKLSGIFPQLQIQVVKASEVLKDLRARYCAKRNLCEDLESVKLCRPQDVVVKAALDLETGANPEESLAEILCEIDAYLSPEVRFQSLDELLESEMAVEQIFEGPLLQYGFITNEALSQLAHRKAVYNSDLIRIISCHEGVQAVRNLLTASYIGLEEVVSDEKNCFLLETSDCYHFRLDLSRSLQNDHICCFQSGVQVELNMARVKQLYRRLKSNRPRRRLQNDCLQLPEATGMDLSQWHSVQYDLPRVYGVGRDGLGRRASNFQKGRAKQLKAFLFFFEQLMANYLSQLSHVGSLFSMDVHVNQTYFYQPLYQLPQIAPIFKAYVDSGQSWDDFVADTHNEYVQALDKATEDFPRFLERRNRFLDHLLARVGEDIAHYEKWVRSYYRDDPEYVMLELIRVKQGLIANYPLLSSPRATAFNYCKKLDSGHPDVWNTDNISGYLKRVCAKVGLFNCKRRYLCSQIPLTQVFEVVEETDDDGNKEWWFRLRADDGSILMTSTDRYASYSLLYEKLKAVVSLSMYRDNFTIKVSNANKYYFILQDENNDTLARRIPGFPTLEEAEEAILAIMKVMWEYFNGEGIHLLEHILLRPRRKHYKLLQPFRCDLQKRRKLRMIKDPYSFVMTAVLPSGYVRDFSNDTDQPQPGECSPRFRDPGYREVIETVLREEAPAHIYLNIFWLDRNVGEHGEFLSFNRFERLYRAWLLNLDKEDSVYRPTSDELVDFMNQLLPTLERPI